MTIQWPSVVPHLMLIKGFNQSPGDNVIRQGMSTGPPKHRRRTTSAPIPVYGSIAMTDDQFDVFEAWYVDDIIDGALEFEFIVPRTGFVHDTIFLEKYIAEPLGCDGWAVNVKLGLLRVSPYTSQIPFIHFPFTSDLVDSKGAIGDGVFTRESAATYFDPNNFDCLMAANGEYEQIVPLASHTPDGTDAWWTHGGLILDNGALIANDVDGYHTMRAVDKLESYNSYMMVVKVKPADKRWIFMRFDDAVLNKQTRIHLDTGEISSLTSGAYAGIDGPDGDGYYTCWLVAYVLDTTVEGKNSIYFYPVVDSSTPTYQGDNSTVDLYIKEFNVFKLPAHMAYGPEEVTDSGMDDPSAWTVGYWTVSGGVATAAPGYGGNFYQTLPGLELGALYRISVQIGGMTTGHVRVSTANGAFYTDGDLNPEIRWEANGTHVRYMTCVDEASIVLWANSTFDGWIDNVSVKRVPNYLAHQIFGPEVLPVEARNPDDNDSFYVKTRCTFSANGAIVADTQDDYHLINTGQGIAATGDRIKYQLKAKKGDKDYIRCRFYTATDGAKAVVYNLATGAIESQAADLDDVAISAVSDEDGYFTLTGIYKCPDGATCQFTIYPYLTASDGIFAGDGSTEDVFIKEISLKIYEPDPKPLPYTTELSVPAEPCFETNGLRIVPFDFANYIEYSEQFDEWNVETSGEVQLTLIENPAGRLDTWKVISTGNITWSGIFGILYLESGITYTVSLFVKFSEVTTFRLGIYCQEDTDWDYFIDFDFANATDAPTSSGNELGSYTNLKIEEKYNKWFRISYTFVTDQAGRYDFRLHPDRGANNGSVYAFGANLTKSPQVLPYVPSYGAVTIMAEEELYYSGCADLDKILGGTVNEGSVVATVVPAYHHDDLDAVQRFVSVNATSGFLTFRGNGSIGLTDADVITTKVCDYEENDVLEVIAAWKKDLRTAVKRVQVLRGGQWYFSDYESYDGAFENGNVIKLGSVNNVCPYHIKDLKFFKRAIFKK